MPCLNEYQEVTPHLSRQQNYLKIDYEGDLGNRVYDVKVNGKEVFDDDTFTICLNSYRAKGTGGYSM